LHAIPIIEAARLGLASEIERHDVEIGVPPHCLFFFAGQAARSMVPELCRLAYALVRNNVPRRHVAAGNRQKAGRDRGHAGQASTPLLPVARAGRGHVMCRKMHRSFFAYLA
jgi:hypothetical protein